MWPRRTYTPFTDVEPGAAPVRLIVYAGEAAAQFPTGPLRHLRAITASSPTGTGRCSNWRPTTAATPRSERHSDLKYGVGLNHMPSGRFAANAAWLAIQVMAHNLARWTARTGLGEQVVPRPCGVGSSPSPDECRSARRLTLHLPGAGLGNPSSLAPWPGCEPFHSRPGRPACN